MTENVSKTATMDDIAILEAKIDWLTERVHELESYVEMIGRGT